MKKVNVSLRRIPTYAFQPLKARNECVKWLRTLGELDKFNKVVVGISGGKDSTVAAALCCEAFGTRNVHGLLLPNGLQPDIDDSITVCKSLGIEYDTINIQPIYEAFLLQYTLSTSDKKFNVCKDMIEADGNLERFVRGCGTQFIKKPTNEACINLSPRIRMAMLRLWGQSHHHRLCGTSNLSEITVGYCTKDGDTSCDFNPLGLLTSQEVVQIGHTYPYIPERLISKTPTDGLCGLSDEEKLGLRYKDIHNYIRKIPGDTKQCVTEKIMAMEWNDMHKRRHEPVYTPSERVLYK